VSERFNSFSSGSTVCAAGGQWAASHLRPCITDDDDGGPERAWGSGAGRGTYSATSTMFDEDQGRNEHGAAAGWIETTLQLEPCLTKPEGETGTALHRRA
jgi:hypothetical protein